MTKTKILGLAVGAGLLMAAGSASAITNPATATIAVTAAVAKACTVTATAINFNYTPTAGAAPGTSTLQVACSTSTPWTLTLNGGLNGTITQRLLKSGANTLQYNLYKDALYTQLFGDGTTGANLTGLGAGLGTPTAVTVYGTVPDNATNQAAVPATTYADTVTVSVAY